MQTQLVPGIGWEHGDPLPLSLDLLLPCPGDPDAVAPSASLPARPAPTLQHSLDICKKNECNSSMMGCCFQRYICTQLHQIRLLWMHHHLPWGFVPAHSGSHLPCGTRSGQLSKLLLTGAKLPLWQVTHPLEQQRI